MNKKYRYNIGTCVDERSEQWHTICEWGAMTMRRRNITRKKQSERVGRVDINNNNNNNNKNE